MVLKPCAGRTPLSLIPFVIQDAHPAGEGAPKVWPKVPWSPRCSSSRESVPAQRAIQQLSLRRRHLTQGQLFMDRAADGPTGQGQERWVLHLRGRRSPGIRLCGCAGTQAQVRNFPNEVGSKLPVTVGEERKQRQSSRCMGVLWAPATSSRTAKLHEPNTKRTRFVGSFVFEEDAARAHDYVAVQAHGPGAKRNLPGEAISEPQTVGARQKERSRSRYLDIS